MDEKQWELIDENSEVANTIVATRDFAEQYAAQNGYTVRPLDGEDEEAIDEMQAKINILWEAFAPTIRDALSPEQIVKHGKELNALGLGSLLETNVEEMEEMLFGDGEMPPPMPERNGGIDE